MYVVKVKIQSLQDVADGIPIKEGITPETVVNCPEITFGILEAGMQSGKTSCMFILENGDGKHYVAECSAEMFETMAGAVKGAKERFGDK